MLKPAHLLSFDKAGMASQRFGAGVFQMQQQVQKMQADAGHQNGRHWHQGHPLARTGAVYP